MHLKAFFPQERVHKQHQTDKGGGPWGALGGFSDSEHTEDLGSMHAKPCSVLMLHHMLQPHLTRLIRCPV